MASPLQSKSSFRGNNGSIDNAFPGRFILFLEINGIRDLYFNILILAADLDLTGNPRQQKKFATVPFPRFLFHQLAGKLKSYIRLTGLQAFQHVGTVFIV